MWSNWAPSPSLLDLGDSLDDAVVLAISSAYVSSTLATRKSQARKYLQFCRLLQTSPFPISVRNLCRYCVKRFNEVVSHYHFKMDALSTITKRVTKNCFTAAIDLKDTYYSVPIRSLDRKFLRFIWEGTLYEFACLPNGLSCAPRIVTKILKTHFPLCTSKVT